MEIALEIEGTADDSAIGDEARVRTFMAASSMNLNLPWEEWLNGGDGADHFIAAGEAMLLQEQEYDERELEQQQLHSSSLSVDNSRDF
eukprot:329662-Rhodomonas_salina.1